MSKKELDALEAAVEILSKDHEEVDRQFGEYKKLMDYEAPAAQRKALADKICDALSQHAEMEEQIFYPAARRYLEKDSEEIMDHADVEHATLKVLIARITSTKASDPHFDAYVHVLGEYVKHHVEEEEDEMFSELRKQGADKEEALEAMKAFKEKKKGARK